MKYFLIFVGAVFCLVITMYSGGTGHRVATADGWVQVGAVDRRDFSHFALICRNRAGGVRP